MRNALLGVYQDGDSTTFHIVTFILDQLQRTGEMPSNRQTARACGVSHTAVAKSLERFRRYFPKPEA